MADMDDPTRERDALCSVVVLQLANLVENVCERCAVVVAGDVPDGVVVGLDEGSDGHCLPGLQLVI